MNDSKSMFLKRKSRQAWALLAIGAVLLATGIALQILAPNHAMNPKAIQAGGIFLISLAAFQLVQYFQAQHNPDLAQKLLVEATDERSLALRHQAGNAAFWSAFLLANIGLFFYSVATRDQPYDALWVWLVVMAVVPMLVYIVVLVGRNSRT